MVYHKRAHLYIYICFLLSAERGFSLSAPVSTLSRKKKHSICSALIRIGVMFILTVSKVKCDLLHKLKFWRLKSGIFFSFQFENLLADDKMKIILKEPLTSNDCPFLRSLFVAANPGQDTLDFTKVKRAEIHGCGFILKLLDGENQSVKCIVSNQ